MISKSSQKLQSKAKLCSSFKQAFQMLLLPFFQNTISWIVLSVQVINNLGAENADFSNAKIKGTILSSVDEGAPFWSDESLWSCCGSTCQTPIKSNRTERGTRAIEYET